MKSFKKKIFKHIKKILNNQNFKHKEKTCNCRKEKCPLDNYCLENNIIYRAPLLTNYITKLYFGLTSITFKNRYSNNKESLNHRFKRNNNKLSKYLCMLNDANKDYNFKLEILCRTKHQT